MKILYQGKVPNSKRRHVGCYIASGPKRHKVLFKPGVNQISVEDFEALLDDDGEIASSGVAARFASGELRIIEDDRPQVEFEKMSSPFDGPSYEAIELVDATIDVSVLRDWRLREKSKPADGRRDDVIAAIDRQIKACTTRPDGTTAEPRTIELHTRNAPEEEPAPAETPRRRRRRGGGDE